MFFVQIFQVFYSIQLRSLAIATLINTVKQR